MFNKSPPVNLVRAYVSPLEGSASVILKTLMGRLSTGAAEPAFKVSINYDVERDLSARNDLTSPMAYSDLECVMVLDEHGDVVLSFSKQFQASVDADVTPVFEITLVRSEDRSFGEEVNILAGLKEFFVPLSGYARTLSSDWSPISEMKLKRGIFGGSSVTIPKRSESWLMSDQAISAGAIRGIYPVNYWSELACESIMRFGLKLPDADFVLDGVRCFGEKQQKKILEDNPRFARYFHFGST